MTSQNYHQSVRNLLSSFNTRVRSIIDMNPWLLKKDYWRWLSVHVCCAFYTIYAWTNLNYGTKMRTFFFSFQITLSCCFFVVVYFLFAVVYCQAFRNCAREYRTLFYHYVYACVCILHR